MTPAKPEHPLRGDVWWISFDAAVGGEIQKTRPALIVSNNASNANLNRVQVVPLTSSTAKLYPSEAYVTVKNRRSKAAADQLTTASKQRLSERLGRISADELEDVERAIRTQLAL